jgi:hemolysin activation/secretion protein
MINASLFRLVARLAIVLFPTFALAQAQTFIQESGQDAKRTNERNLDRANIPEIRTAGDEGPPGAERVMLVLRDIQIAGATVYDSRELATICNAQRGRKVSLRTIYDFARCITEKYQHDGYILSRAILPAQKINPRAAVIRVQVIEGFVDKVEWTRDLSRYRDFFTYFAAKITAERPANKRTIERYTLLAEDLPGIGVKTRFEPSQKAPGASTLVVEIEEKPLDLYARAETQRVRNQQNAQVVGSATFNNPTGQHEALTIGYTGWRSTTPLQFAIATYRHILTSEGLTGFAEASRGWGSVGTVDLEMPDGVYSVTARSRAADAGFSFPVTRSREFNLNLIGLAFLDNRQSVVLPVPQIQDRLRGVRFKLDGDMIDFLKTSYEYTFIASQGIQGFGSTQNSNPIASNPAGRVDFTKLEGFASASSRLPHEFSLKLTTYFQYAFAPLLQQEQCSFGGRVLGRAFNPGGLLGDDCYQVAAELRRDVPTEGSPLSLLQPYIFVDHGNQYNIQPSPGSPRTFDATSAGAGIRLGWQDKYRIDLFAAKAVEGPTNDWRLMLFSEARF